MDFHLWIQTKGQVEQGEGLFYLYAIKLLKAPDESVSYRYMRRLEVLCYVLCYDVALYCFMWACVGGFSICVVNKKELISK